MILLNRHLQKTFLVLPHLQSIVPYHPVPELRVGVLVLADWAGWLQLRLKSPLNDIPQLLSRTEAP